MNCLLRMSVSGLRCKYLQGQIKNISVWLMLVENLTQEDSFGRLFFLSMQSFVDFYFCFWYWFYFPQDWYFWKVIRVLHIKPFQKHYNKLSYNNEELSFFEHLLFPRHWTELYFYLISFSSLYVPMWQLLLKIPFYRFGNRVLE